MFKTFILLNLLFFVFSCRLNTNFIVFIYADHIQNILNYKFFQMCGSILQIKFSQNINLKPHYRNFYLLQKFDVNLYSTIIFTF